MKKPTQHDLTLIATAYAKDFFGIPTPAISFATAAEIGRCVEGRAFPRTNQIWIRRYPKYTNLRFLIAHELAHLYQAAHGLPQTEANADELALACCGHGAGVADY